MSGEPKLFRINRENQESEPVDEVNFADLGLRERQDIQEWVAAHPSILGDNLLIIGKEFRGFDRTNERPDLLAVDSDGTLVIIELKRDDTGTDVHWQAIKYASYFHHATADDIIGILAGYRGIVKEEAEHDLLQHLEAQDLAALNQYQRIILASHRFAPEVITAVLWLNEKAPEENLITCVELIPYQDKQSGALYLRANTIIPPPGIDEYIIKPGSAVRSGRPGSGGSFAANLRSAFARNKNDEVTHFLRRVGALAINGLPNHIKPDQRSKWAGRHNDRIERYYHLWYSRAPWSNWGTSYWVVLRPDPEEQAEHWRAHVIFRHDRSGLAERLADISISNEWTVNDNRVSVGIGHDTLNDEFGDRIAEMLRKFIENITPIVNAFEAEGNEANV